MARIISVRGMPAVYGVAIWLLFYFFAVKGWLHIEVLIDMGAMFPGLTKTIACYSLSKEDSIQLIMLAWFISLMVLFLENIFVDSRRFYIKITERLNKALLENYSGKKSHIYLLVFVLVGFVISPYIRFLFGYTFECPNYPVRFSGFESGVFFESLWLVGSGEVLGLIVVYFRGRIKVLNKL